MYAEHTDVRWTSEPSAIMEYFTVVGGVGNTAVIAAEGVLLTGSDKRRITDCQ